MASRLAKIALFCLVAATWSHTVLAQCTLTPPPPPPSPKGVVCPAGDGDPAAEAWLVAASGSDPIAAVLLDGSGIPIVNYPFEDIWLGFGGFCNCVIANGDVVVADSNTDALGRTSFTMSLAAAARTCAPAPMITLYINGTPCATSSYGAGVQVTTLDFNCDGILSPLDDAAMKPAYNAHLPCADLDNNAKWDMFDAGVLAEHEYPVITYIPLVFGPAHHCP